MLLAIGLYTLWPGAKRRSIVADVIYLIKSLGFLIVSIYVLAPLLRRVKSKSFSFRSHNSIHGMPLSVFTLSFIPEYSSIILLISFVCFCLQAPKKDKAPPPSSKPAKSGGGKQKKKKWSKGKQKEKVNNMVLFDQGTYDKLLSEAPKYKLITPSILSDRLRVNGSLARKAIRELMARGSIRMVSAHASQQIYTRATNT
ncbi:hypothetical protein RJT34_31883 [Clitoria ternatea]|uniref:40S ribosomal protein S25 n=1 Tax=Clitoria ternatea TaxID=43366 RepID=A0AAN9EVU3_CLITE